MEQIGTVQRLQGSQAVILVRRTSACGENCASCKSVCTKTTISAMAENPLGANVGDVVKIETDTKRLIFAAVLLYFVPLLLAMVCAVAAQNFSASKTVVTILAVAVFLAAFFVMQKQDKRLAPVSYITKIIQKNPEKV